MITGKVDIQIIQGDSLYDDFTNIMYELQKGDGKLWQK